MADTITKASGIAYGFKRLHIITRNSDGTKKNHHIIEGKEGLGASQVMEIDGLSKEPTKVAGSDTVYYQSRKGTGSVTANITLLDMPYEVENEILGKKVTSEGTALTGRDTEAPYVSVMGESETAGGDKVYAVLLRGVFRREKYALNTLDPSEDFKPEGVEYGFSAENLNSSDEEYDGQVFAHHIGKAGSAKKLFTILGINDEPVPAATPNGK